MLITIASQAIPIETIVTSTDIGADSISARSIWIAGIGVTLNNI